MNTTITQKQAEARREFKEWLRGFNKRATNRLTMRFAGKHVYAVIHHRARCSQRGCWPRGWRGSGERNRAQTADVS